MVDHNILETVRPGMKYNSFAIMGPTCIGKTSTAISLAKKHDGCLIPADSFQFYEGVNVGGWKQYEKKISEVPRLLYCSLPINAPIISYEDFYTKAGWARREALSDNLIPIFEGCHSGFARHLAGTKRPPASEYGPIGVIVLMPYKSTSHSEIEDKVRRRLAEYIDKGIVEETKQILDCGGPDTALMRSWFLRYFGNHIRGQIDLDDAISQTHTEWMKCVDKQLDQFQSIKNSHTLRVELDNPETTEGLVEKFVADNIDEHFRGTN